MGAFLGMRGTGDWATNERPENWRQKILELSPNGSTPLIGMTSMLKSEPIDDPKFHWWTRSLSTQGATVTGVYIENTLTTKYVYATHHSTSGITGSSLFVKLAEADAKMFREGHQVTLRDSDQYTVDVNAKVVGVTLNGASSFLSVRLLEADDNGSTPASYNLATVDRVLVTGNINSQGGVRPPSIHYDPTEVYNVSQIWRTSLDMTRTAMKTKLRTRDAYLDEKTQTLLYHGVEMEKNLIWGIRTENTGANGKPEYTTMGLVEFIKTYASANVDDYRTNTGYTGKSWLEKGDEWLDNVIKTVFSKVPDSPNGLGGEKLVLCGAGALLGIQRLVKALGLYTLTANTTSYGIKVTTWETVFGTLHFKVHPLFSWETTNDYSMLIIEPQYIIWRPLDDTFFKPDPSDRQGGGVGVDGKQEEFITEGGYEYHYPETMGYFNGVGCDNPLS